MGLTKEEKAICKKYGEYINGKVRCSECPLAVDTRYCVCKKNATAEEYREYKEMGV